MTTHTILYHQHCADGSAAALAAWLALGEHEARYIPCSYGRPLPDDIEPGSDVYLLDFTAKRGEMLALAMVAGRITVLDHHASAAAELAGLPEQARNTLGACEIRTVFDLNRSGCALAWAHFHPGKQLPWLLQLIEDRDLWRFALLDSRDLHCALDLDEDFRALASYIVRPRLINDLVADGRVIRAHLQRQWRGVVAAAGPLLRWPAHAQNAYGAPSVRLVNCPPQWFSDVGHLLLATEPCADIAILYSDDERTHRRSWSLRSRKGGPDVSRIAATYGGGGHPNAAGFCTDLDAYDLGLTPCFRTAEYSAARLTESAAA